MLNRTIITTVMKLRRKLCTTMKIPIILNVSIHLLESHITNQARMNVLKPETMDTKI